MIYEKQLEIIHNSAMKYEQITPAEHLRKHIRSVSIMEGKVSDSEPTAFHTIADGCPGILFLENPDTFSENNNTSSPHLTLHKSASKYAKINMKHGDLNLISIQLQPAAVKSIFDIDANDLTESHFNLELITDQRLTAQLLHAPSNTVRVDMLVAFLIEKLRKNEEQKTDKILYAIDLLQADNPVISLQKIQNQLNLSERSLERLFHQYIGISPKVFARIVRFQKALTEMRNKSFSKFTDIAYNNSYADQSHFIRDFKEFTGASPFRFLKQANERMENFAEWNS